MFLFCGLYLTDIEQCKLGNIEGNNFCNLNCLTVQHFGSAVLANSSIINNLPKLLLEAEKFMLFHGLKFCPPPASCICKSFAEFEALIRHFPHTVTSKEQLSSLKAILSDLAYAYCETLVGL